MPSCLPSHNLIPFAVSDAIGILHTRLIKGPTRLVELILWHTPYNDLIEAHLKLLYLPAMQCMPGAQRLHTTSWAMLAGGMCIMMTVWDTCKREWLRL
jgi:hypothetical protein